MKFAQYLHSEQVPEWRDMYIDYNALKSVMKTSAIAVNTAMEKGVLDDPTARLHEVAIAIDAELEGSGESDPPKEQELGPEMEMVAKEPAPVNDEDDDFQRVIARALSMRHYEDSEEEEGNEGDRLTPGAVHEGADHEGKSEGADGEEEEEGGEEEGERRRGEKKKEKERCESPEEHNHYQSNDYLKGENEEIETSTEAGSGSGSGSGSGGSGGGGGGGGGRGASAATTLSFATGKKSSSSSRKGILNRLTIRRRASSHRFTSSGSINGWSEHINMKPKVDQLKKWGTNIWENIKPLSAAKKGEAEVEDEDMDDFDYSMVPEPSRPFFVALNAEIRKAQRFYLKQQRLAKARFDELMLHVARLNSTDDSIAKAAETKRLRDAFLEFYRHLNLLKNFGLLNYSAIGKILKKFDKNAGTEIKKDLLKVLGKRGELFNESDIDTLVKRTEEVFTTEIAKGDRKKGMNELRLPGSGSSGFEFTYLLDGWFLGCLFPCIVAIIYSVVTKFDTFDPSEFATITRVYAGFVVFVVYLWLLGVNFLVWKRFRINYVFIFEFDPRHHIEIPSYFQLVSLFSCVTGYSYLAYLWRIGEPAFSPQYHPIILMGVYLAILFFPFSLFYRKSRIWLLKELWRVISAPLNKVEFADFFLGDQFCSMVYVLLSLQYTICSFLPGNPSVFLCNQHEGGLTIFLAALPSWLRLVQSFRRYRDLRDVSHLLNAGKYAMGICVPFFAGMNRIYQHRALLVIYIICALGSWTYASYWDIKRDWSLLDPKAKHKFLRKRLAYPWPWVYYVCIVVNLILRAAWIVTLSENPSSPQVRDFFLALAEVYRRFQWNFFRLENEQLNNAGKFRAVKDIPLASNLSSHHTGCR